MKAFARLFAAAAVAALAGLSAQALANGSGDGGASKSTSGPSLPTGALVPLDVAGPLAVAPDGWLYVVDTGTDRVLARLPDGRFRVVAGDGETGFAGDRGPAIDAELLKVTDMGFSPNGSLYLADGSRVRVVAPDGIIRTVAGSGQPTSDQALVANGTPALSAALPAVNGLSLALSPAGVLYVSTGNQILYLRGGRLDAIRDHITSGFFAGKSLNSFDQVAIDSHNDIDISGFNGWAIWQIAPNGTARQITMDSEARRSGGNTSVLERAPAGAVYGESASALMRIGGDHLELGYVFNDQINGEWFPMTYFAFAPDGTVYADDIPGGSGFERYQLLVSESARHVMVLWGQSSDT